MIYFQIILVVVFGLIFNKASIRQNTRDRNRISYIVICLTMFWLVGALRSVEWVTSMRLDAGGYEYLFNIYRTMDWGSMVETLFQNTIFSDSDIGYVLLNKIIGEFTESYNIFSLLADLLFFVPFGLLLYKHTEKVIHCVFAFIFYIALLQTHIFSGARQMFAVGLDIMAVLFFIDNKKVKSIICFVIGVTIHFSSLLTLIPLVLIYLDFKPTILKILHFLSFIGFPLVFAFPNQVITFLANVVSSERYAGYGSGTIQGGADTFIFLMGLLSVFCYIAINKKCLKDSVNIRKLYTVLPFVTLFAPLIHSNGSMERICLYFYVYLMVLFPLGMDRLFSKRSQRLAYVLVLGTLILLMTKGGVRDYHFMWQSL